MEKDRNVIRKRRKALSLEELGLRVREIAEHVMGPVILVRVRKLAYPVNVEVFNGKVMVSFFDPQGSQNLEFDEDEFFEWIREMMG